MHRFFVAPELLRGVGVLHAAPTITLPTKLAHQVRDVLRIGVGEQLILFDNSGDEVVAEVVRSNHTGVEVQPVERRAGKSESAVRIILCQGLLKSARFEWILEKGTELGVSTFVPTLCRRSMAGLENPGSSKLQRWQHIIQEAAEQCGRACLPELLPIRPLKHALNDIPPGALALIPWEEEREHTLRTVLRSRYGEHPPGGTSPADSQSVGTQFIRPTITVVLFIGPEGGLMAEEIKLAQRYGVQVVTLGTRILRAETAALTAIANVMYELGG
jgi:16S rRNA (uracil1498-N3)-methyltransferase